MNMLWAAEAMIVMSWLPDVFGEQPEVREMEPVPFTGNLRNMEHIAAASAAIQNILGRQQRAILLTGHRVAPFVKEKHEPYWAYLWTKSS